MAALKIYTDTFEFSHGKKPRGTGCWAFLVMDASGPRPKEVETIFAPGMKTLAEAKAWIKEEIQTKWAEELKTGFLYLEVAP